MGALDRIKISGYKSIREADIKLGALNVLIGANGAGKTNFISVFKLLNQIVEENLQRYAGEVGGAESLLYFGQKVTGGISIGLQFNVNGYQVELVPASSDTLIFGEEICWFHNKRYPIPYRISLGKGHKETLLIEESLKKGGNIPRYVLESLKAGKFITFTIPAIAQRLKKRVILAIIVF